MQISMYIYMITVILLSLLQYNNSMHICVFDYLRNICTLLFYYNDLYMQLNKNVPKKDILLTFSNHFNFFSNM